MKKATALMLLLALLLSLTACGASESHGPETEENNIISPAEFTFTDEIQQLSHQALKLPEDIDLQYARACCGTVLVSGLDKNRERHFYTVSADKSEPVEITGFQPEGTEQLAVSPGGALHILRTDSEGRYEICTRSPEGQFSRIQPELEGFGGMATQFSADDRGYYIELEVSKASSQPHYDAWLALCSWWEAENMMLRIVFFP